MGTCESPQRVAICIGGGVRTFTDPAVYTSVGRNLIGSFANGSLGDTAVVFTSLKLSDTMGRASALNNKLSSVKSQATEGDVHTVLHWLAQANPHAHIVPPKLSQNLSAYDMARCGDLPRHWTGMTCLWPMALSRHHEQAVLAQLETRYWCGEAMKSWLESHRDMPPFDWLLITRPDILFHSPVTRACLWDAKDISFTTTVAPDSTFVLPAVDFESLGSGWRDWQQCKDLTDLGYTMRPERVLQEKFKKSLLHVPHEQVSV